MDGSVSVLPLRPLREKRLACRHGGLVFIKQSPVLFLLSREIVLPLPPEFRRHRGGIRKDFIEKGVIEIIFYIQTSQL